jgi:hypothetical protein
MADAPDKPQKGHFAKLALWVAGGGKIAPWCRKNSLAPRTAYRWSKTSKFQAKVDEYRRRASDRAIGLLARHAVTAIEGMVRLAKNAEAEPVKLSAQRGILAELREMSDFASISRRLAEIERRLDEHNTHQTPAD